MMMQWAALLAGLAAARGADGVSVSVSIDVVVPLQVPAGASFHDAALEFAQRNGLGAGEAGQIEAALQARWSKMQEDNQRRTQCGDWQMAHAVRPLKDWGTLPAELRVQWLRLDCDSAVPDEPPSALATLDVQVGDTVLVLRAYDGDTVRYAVERFAAAHGIDMAQSGKLLIDALYNKLRAQQEAARAAEEREKSFLFSLPVNVDGQLQRLRVYEGDELQAIVKAFCERHGVSYAASGAQISKAVMDTTEMLRSQLESDAAASKRALDKKAEPRLLLDIPFVVDGKEYGMKLYDGDFVDVKIADFCAAHGLDTKTHGMQMLADIQRRTEALNAGK